MADERPHFDPIAEGVFPKGTPIRHKLRKIEPCSTCQTDTPHDYLEAIVGVHVGFGLPFGKKSTLGKMGKRSHWCFCAACGSVIPVDREAEKVMAKLGLRSEKTFSALDGASVEEISKSIALGILGVIGEESLENLAAMGIDRESPDHKRELLLLALHAFSVPARTKAPSLAQELVPNVVQIVNHVFSEELGYRDKPFEELASERFAEYDRIVFDEDAGAGAKLDALGAHFGGVLGLDDPTDVERIPDLYGGWMKGTSKLLSQIG